MIPFYNIKSLVFKSIQIWVLLNSEEMTQTTVRILFLYYQLCPFDEKQWRKNNVMVMGIMRPPRQDNLGKIIPKGIISKGHLFITFQKCHTEVPAIFLDSLSFLRPQIQLKFNGFFKLYVKHIFIRFVYIPIYSLQ